jgi:hypothetical protein
MPINRLLAKSVFQPDEVQVMAKAFEATCASLGLSHRDEPIGELVASKVIECACTGERDPERLSKLILSELEKNLRGAYHRGLGPSGLDANLSTPLTSRLAALSAIRS